MIARSVAAVSAALLLFLPSPATAHPFSEHGNILAPGADPARAGPYHLLLHGVLEETGLHSTAGDLIPNGVVWWDIHEVEGGDGFTLLADDGQEPFVVGLGDGCPGPAWDPTDPDQIENSNLVCNNHPDFDVSFSGGAYGNGPGDEAGFVPGDGEAIIVLFFGDAGEGFTYTEG